MNWSAIIVALIQMTGAVTIAWLAVQWAEKRFRSEKRWERTLSGYADLVGAMSELLLSLGYRADSLLVHTLEEQSRRERLKAARAEFDRTVAVSRILLPANLVQALLALQIKLDRTSRDEIDDIYDKYGEVEEVLEKVLREAESALR